MFRRPIRLAAGNFFLISLILFGTGLLAVAQTPAPTKYKTQELEEKEGVPVLMTHLPDWQQVRGQAKFATSIPDLKTALGERPILDTIDFSAGTEAVTAPYGVGKLLIIEYGTPQGSVDADSKFKTELAGDPQGATTVYRRIGNYNALVFDTSDVAAANTLLDQVKYEKNVQWLGENPFILRRAERNFVLMTSDLFLSTVLIIVLGFGFSIVGGIVAGYIFFYIRDQKRAGMPTFSDAGGMTRLNLDGFTPEILPLRLPGK